MTSTERLKASAKAIASHKEARTIRALIIMIKLNIVLTIAEHEEVIIEVIIKLIIEVITGVITGVTIVQIIVQIIGENIMGIMMTSGQIQDLTGEAVIMIDLIEVIAQTEEIDLIEEIDSIEGIDLTEEIDLIIVHVYMKKIWIVNVPTF